MVVTSSGASSPVYNVLDFTTAATAAELDNMFAVPLSAFAVRATGGYLTWARRRTPMVADTAGRLYMGTPLKVMLWDALRGSFDVSTSRTSASRVDVQLRVRPARLPVNHVLRVS